MTKSSLHEWLPLPCQQQPTYKNKRLLTEVLEQLSQMPPLVEPEELAQLQTLLAQAAEGKAFILQGGNCAELFSDCEADVVKQKLVMLRQLSLILETVLDIPVVAVGRIAGQYAKPRTVLQETRGELCLPSYRGDLINQPDFNLAAREPDPSRLLLGYQTATRTIAYIHDYLAHESAHIGTAAFWKRAEHEIKQLAAVHIDINRTIELAHNKSSGLLPLFTSHEALLLAYETALTRTVDGHRYNTGTHFPWIGMRTSDPTMNHVTYAADIANPIAVKIGTQVNTVYLSELMQRLNPKRVPGRLTFIHRFGRGNIAELLPPLIKAAQKMQMPITWICDPMHGNTHFTAQGIKTRQFTDIAHELLQATQIHKAHDSILAGIHIEMTEEHVTECLGSMQQLTEVDLTYGYKSLVDPRLNYGQALELLLDYASYAR